MQTYSHLLFGALAGATVTHDPLISFACAAGAALPDMVMVPVFIWDAFHGRKPLDTHRPWLQPLKHTSHSIPLWFALCCAAHSLGTFLILAFCLGGLSHPFIDWLTHGNPELNKNDFLYFAPWQKHHWNIGSIDYRIDHGDLRPKPLELAFDVACAAGTVVGLT
jgi:hypothetical protein